MRDIFLGGIKSRILCYGIKKHVFPVLDLGQSGSLGPSPAGLCTFGPSSSFKTQIVCITTRFCAVIKHIQKNKINRRRKFEITKTLSTNPTIILGSGLFDILNSICFLLLIHCLLYQVLMATWRNGRPPVRFDDPVHVVLPRHNVVLYPFKGQPRKYAEPRRLPGCEVKKSGIPKAGNGLWLAERVRKGQTITIFRRKRISEAAAKKLQRKVQIDFV